MHITSSMPGKILAGIGIGVSCFLTLVFLPEAFASQTELQPFTITSPDFRDGGQLSSKNGYNQSGCTGSNIAPTLNWTNPPVGTRSLVMLMSDSDASGFYHWIVYNIPANVHQLGSKSGFSESVNSYGSDGYGGPCPPATGKTHHYVFSLYATNREHIDGKDLGPDQIMKAMQGHILGTARLTGTYRLP